MQPSLLVCALTSQASICGAEGRWCHLCGAAVWVSPAMLRNVDRGSVLPTCPHCASGLIPQVAGPAVIHPDQVEELRRTGLLGTARRIVEGVNMETARHRSSPR